MKKTVLLLYILVSGFIASTTLNSCVSSKNLAYFSNIPRDSTSQIHEQMIETLISKNDILQIDISTLDPTTTQVLNSVSATGPASATNNYLVDESGIIKIPLLGPIKAEGLTKRQLASVITDDLLTKKIAKDPIVTVRISNFKVTVLGEVAKPGMIAVPNEQITLPQALGEAGDLTAYGKRNNVLLIREINGKRIYKRFSLNTDQLFDKDIYNLRNQDIIYVEPNNAKAGLADRTTQLLPIAVSVVSLLVVIYVQLLR